MTEAFDPYRKWLGIPPAEQPPHHYRLLGVGLYEDDPDVIEIAADQRMTHLRTFQAGANSDLSQRLLNEVSAAKLCLLSKERKAAYDADLRRQLDAPRQVQVVPVAGPPKLAANQPSDLFPLDAMPLDSLSSLGDSPAPVLRKTAPRTNAGNQRVIVWGASGAAALAVLAVLAYALSGGSKPSPASQQSSTDAPPTVAVRDAQAQPVADVRAKPATAAPPAKNEPKVNATAAVPSPAVPSPAVPSPAVPSPAAPSPAVAPFDAEQAHAHQQAWAAYLKTPVEQKNSIGMSLVLIPPGEFTMGSTPEQIEAAKRAAEQENKTYLDWTLKRIETEAPAHRVAISQPFLLGATEVTVGQYRRFIEASGYVTETERLGGGSSTSKEERDPAKKSLTWSAPSYPVNDDSAASQITWNDAVAFCNWLSEAEQLSRCYLGDEQAGWTLSPSGNGYRLPTEAEWEYACRAGTTTQYSFADDASTLAQYGWSNKTGAIPFPVRVGSKQPNPFGLYDMHGNVEEWCFDWFSPKYYAESPLADPTGSVEGNQRIKRGGAWDGPLVNARAALRHTYPPFYRFGDLGFRVIRVSVTVDGN